MPPTAVANYSRVHLFRQYRVRTTLRRPRIESVNLATAVSARSESSLSKPSKQETSISAILSKPTWSVKSLLPSKSDAANAAEPPISRNQLLHLLRLSALPPPSSPSEEARMLETLSSQIHFVQQVQQIDTADVSPLRSIRDETDEAHKENTVDTARLQSHLEQEEFVGRNRRIRRRRAPKDERPDGSAWNEEDALLKSGERMGRYFVVRSSDLSG